LLLILTNRDDLTADFLIVRLLELAKPYFRFNSEDISEAEYYYSAGPNTTRRKFITSGRILDLDKITCVWYRRAPCPVPSKNIRGGAQGFALSEIRHLTEGSLYNPGILWVNPMDAVMIAEHKLAQLRVAHDLGFNVPPTIVSNNPARLRKFVVRYREDVICKAIYQGLVLDNGQRFAVYTHEVRLKDLDDELQLRSCPTLLQRRIKKGSDLRVTIIGESVFAVEIVSAGPPPLDWRTPEAQPQFRNFRLPKQIEARCRTFLKRFRLVFGAFDFVRTPEGEIYFLELNPTGEWAWLERDLGLPMRDAFIKLFGV
jgi:hypothetical protein